MLDKAINIKILKQILILKGHWCVHIFSLSINHMLAIDLRLTIMLSLLLKFLVQFLWFEIVFFVYIRKKPDAFLAGVGKCDKKHKRFTI